MPADACTLKSTYFFILLNFNVENLTLNSILHEANFLALSNCLLWNLIYDETKQKIISREKSRL